MRVNQQVRGDWRWRLATGEATSGSVQSSAAPANEPKSRLAEQSECTERQETKLKTLCAVRIGAKRSDTAGRQAAGHDTLAICRVTLNCNDYNELQRNGKRSPKPSASAQPRVVIEVLYVRLGYVISESGRPAGRPASSRQTRNGWRLRRRRTGAHRQQCCTQECTLVYSTLARDECTEQRQKQRAQVNVAEATQSCSTRETEIEAVIAVELTHIFSHLTAHFLCGKANNA